MAGHDKVSDAGRATTCRLKFKAPSLKTKITKTKDIPRTWVLMGKQFEDFRQKTEQKHYSRTFKKPQWDTRTLKPSTEYHPCIQKELHKEKLERRPSYQNCWNFARLELRSQVLICSTFM